MKKQAAAITAMVALILFTVWPTARAENAPLQAPAPAANEKAKTPAADAKAPAPAAPTGGDINEAQHKADEDARKAREEAAFKEAEILSEQGKLEAVIAELEGKKKAVDGINAGLKQRYDENEKKIAQIQKRAEEIKSESDELAGSMRGIAQDLGVALSQSMVSAESPGRKKVLEPLVTQMQFPSLENVQKMGDVLFDEISRNGKISVSTLSYVDATGKETRGEVTRIGNFNALWRAGGNVGYLEYSPAKEAFTAFSAKMPSSYIRDAQRFTENKSSMGLYIDPSSGGAFRFISDMPDWWEELKSGGSLMWPICFVGILGAFIALERLLVLLRESKKTQQLSATVTPVIQQGKWDEALGMCSRSTASLARVLTAGINHRQEAPEVLESVIEEAIQGTMKPLDRNMASLQIIAVVAPLLGLLGTVTGMIATFQMLTIYGSGDPRMMSGGISEALITTEYGLFIAIPIILVHGYFQGRVNSIINTLEEKAMMLVNAVKKGEGSRS
jgi:biopolymer transport protein ExbB